jgi:putative tricarboxylic transport membrane protein
MPEKNTVGNKNQTDLFSSILLILLGALIWWLSGKFPNLPEGYPGPGLFPGIIAIALAFIGSVLLIGVLQNKSYLQKQVVEESMRTSPLKLFGAVVVVSFFPIISSYLSFLPTLALTGMAIGLIFSIRWWKAIVVATVTTFGVYLIFSELLGVPL